MRQMFLALIATLTGCLLSVPALAELKIQQVTDNIYALIGPTTQRTPENFGNNATFGVVITPDGVVLADPGGSLKGAEEIMAAIRTLTDLPVKVVINTGGQDHRWLGNSYFRAQGATIIASEAAVEDQKERESLQLLILDNLIGAALEGTEPVTADVTFEESHSFELGGVAFEITYTAEGHTPGDSFVWIPSARTVIAGDIVYIERMLSVGSQSASAGWVDSYEAMAAHEPEHIIPGHGPATTLARANAETYDYLIHLRQVVGAFLEEGGDMQGSVEVDQAAFSFLKNFDGLSRRNAQRVFEEMEFE